MPMRFQCLSIKEPWLELILTGRKQLGSKEQVEFRTRYTKHRGPLLLASSRGLDVELASGQDYRRLGLPDLTRLPYGDAVAAWPLPLGRVRGVAYLGTVSRFEKPEPFTAEGNKTFWGWRLSRIRRLEHPFSVRGYPWLYPVLDIEMPAPALDELVAWLDALTPRPSPQSNP